MPEYVHGYSGREGRRLRDQANALSDLLHWDSVFPAGSRVLEAGCGVGAQTVILAPRNPGVRFVSIDISEESLAKARAAVARRGLRNVEFRQADLFALPFDNGEFDHVFVCFVLEHLADPVGALRRLKRVLKPGGTITVIEGDHGSAYFHPDSDAARRAIRCLVDLQAEKGGNSLIGRQLYPLLRRAGFRNVAVSPRMVYVDGSRPDLVKGFTLNTFTAMVEGVRAEALDSGTIDDAAWDRGIRDLRATASSGGTFCYTFFKATGIRTK